MNNDLLMAAVKKHEGLSLKAYKDSAGVWTIGYGHNLQEIKISSQQASDWLAEDLFVAVAEACAFPEYQHLQNDARENAFCELVFNIGAPRVRKFTNMLTAINNEDWTTAAREMLNSEWAKEVGARATELANMMLHGVFPV